MIDKQILERVQKLKNKKQVTILGIETSCDETSVAVVVNGVTVLSNVVDSQIEIHKKFGGVVPEVASRNHINKINNVLNEALLKADINLKKVDAIAVTYGAGLQGALLVGISFAKALSFALNVPLIAVNHIKGHIAANYITYKDLKPPFICLIVSGGHTAILNVKNYVSETLIGSTLDDAVGECFDKVARVLGLSYPGGPNIEKQAKEGNNTIEFIKKDMLRNTYDFSFSGVKTAVLNYVNKEKQKGNQINIKDVCASFQNYVVKSLVDKSIAACVDKKIKKLVVAGGVSANQFLKQELISKAKPHGITVYIPPVNLCTDNAAMIASAGYFNLISNKGISDYDLKVSPTIKI